MQKKTEQKRSGTNTMWKMKNSTAVDKPPKERERN